MSFSYALWKDPRVVGAATSILWILLDDLPIGPYGTFKDPGAAAMQSIIFGQFAALAVYRGWDKTAKWWFLVAGIFKVLFQGLFYVQDAAPIDLGTLFGAHLLVAILASRQSNASAVVSRCGVAAVSFLVAYCLCFAVYRYCDQRHYNAYYWSFALARASFPYFLWTSLLLLRSRVPRPAWTFARLRDVPKEQEDLPQ